MNLRDAFAVALLMASALAMLFFLRLYRKRLGSDAEWVRKLAHIGTGLMSICLPWIFATRLPVFIICGASVALLLSMRYLPFVRSRFSGVLDGVARESWGEICFPISVALLFQLSRGDKLLYTVPLVVLTLADTVAALTGEEYGKHQYAAAGATKSMEGSIAFFTAAFFSVNVALVVFSDAGRIETLLISIDIAIVVMLLEAIAWRGLDNVFIPLGVFILLKLYLAMQLSQLWNRFRIAAALVLFVTAYARRTTLQGSALLASALVLYVCWSIGGWQWLLPPLLLFLAYSLFFPQRITTRHRTHNSQAVLAVASTGIFWLFLSRFWHQPDLFYPYTVAFAIHFAIVGWSLLYPRFPSATLIKASCVLAGWALMFVPYILIEGSSTLAWTQAGLALLVSSLAFMIFYWIEPARDGIYPASSARWARQVGIVLASTLAARIL